MRTLNSYLVHHTPAASQSPNISSDTLEALENAEKLVQEARQTIIQASYSLPTLDFIAERQSMATDVDENELYIRDIVMAQFQKANGQISSTTNFPTRTKTNLAINRLSKVQRIICKETIERGRVRCRETKKKMETCKECFMSKDENKLRGKLSLGTFRSEKGARVDIKPQLSLRNVERLDLFPVDTNSKIALENVKTYEFKHDSANSATINGSLIDAAVQTSLCELPAKESSTLTNKLTELPANMAQSSSANQITQQRTMENSTVHVEASEEVNGEEKRLKENNTKESRGSFFDFLQHIAELQKNELGSTERNDVEKNSEEDTVFSDVDEEYDDDFDAKKIVLTPPNIEKFDETIRDLNGKMNKILEDIDEFNNEFGPMTVHYDINDIVQAERVDKNTSPITLPKDVESTKKKMNLKIRNGKEKCSDVRASVKFLLGPRSRISSADSTESSETMLPPSKFSTPLNNYRRVDDIAASNIDVKNSRNTVEEFFIPIDEPDMKNDASKVIMTRNKFSSVSSMDENLPEVGKKNDTMNIDANSHPIMVNNGWNEAGKYLSNATTKLQSSQGSHESSKSHTINTEKKVDTKIINKNELCRDIKNVDQSVHVVIDNDNETVTANSREASDHKHEECNKESSHESCKTLKSERAELNMDELNNKTEEENKSIVILDKTNPTPPELSTRDRTSLDVSAIYSESFEASSVTEVKNISEDIINGDNKDNNETSRDKNRVEMHSINEPIDSIENIKKPAESTSLHSKENTPEISFSQLSKSSNSTHTKTNEKTEHDKNTISISSSSTSSLRKLSSINSVSSSQKSNEFKRKFSADDCYSEGELYLPSSCSYSLGEIRIVERDQRNNTNKNTITNHPISFASSISISPAQSPGEVLDSDIESNTSIEKEH